MNVFEILKRKYPEREYALMEEVSDASGFHRSRSADFVAVNLYPSRGLAITGIELKSFRSDWLSELKKPEKAENIFQYCDYFYLLTTSEDIARIEEIPPTWGWYVIKGEKIYTKKQAPNLTPKPLSRHFACAMLKRAQDKTMYIRRDTVQSEINSARLIGEQNGSSKLDRIQRDFEAFKKTVNEFEQSTGINLSYFSRYGESAKTIGNAVRFIHDGGAKSIQEQLLNLEGTVKIISERISKGLESLKALPNELQ